MKPIDWTRLFAKRWLTTVRKSRQIPFPTLWDTCVPRQCFYRQCCMHLVPVSSIGEGSHTKSKALATSKCWHIGHFSSHWLRRDWPNVPASCETQRITQPTSIRLRPFGLKTTPNFFLEFSNPGRVELCRSIGALTRSRANPNDVGIRVRQQRQ